MENNPRPSYTNGSLKTEYWLLSVGEIRVGQFVDGNDGTHEAMESFLS